MQIETQKNHSQAPFINPNSELYQEFWDKGFVLIKNLIDVEKVRAAKNWLLSHDLKSLAKTFTDQEPLVPLAVYQYLQNSENPVGDLVRDPATLKIAEQLLGEPIYIWSSKVNLKAAWYGTAEYYHQDYAYWKERGYAKDTMMSCMVFMDNHSIKNAALHVIPHSHKEGFLEHVPFINTNGLQKFTIPEKTMNELSGRHGLHVIDAKPGDALFFHANLIHGSSHNISGDPRMIMLSQINTMSNRAQEVQENAKRFLLSRAKSEMDTALERYHYFKQKYEEQLKSQELLFNSPIATEEKS
ncbi:MAG: phytanoyl-CoA dioxygenase family protein [Bdellovibrionales bacterium]